MSTPERGYARDNILTNKAFLQEEVIGYIATNYSSIKYSKTKCRQDVGYIIDALAYDLTYGGNWQTQNAGLAYYDGVSGTLQIASSEKAATIAAYGYLKTILQTTGQNIAVNPVEQTTVAQVLGANSSNATTPVLNTLITDMIDIGITVRTRHPFQMYRKCRH